VAETTDVQTQFLDSLVEQQTPVWVFLINGIKLIGIVTSFDRYVLTVKSPSGSQMVLKSAVSTVIEQHAPLPRAAETRESARVAHRSPQRIR
jgi:host factor-I protein